MLLTFILLGVLYTTGWLRLRRKSRRNTLANGWRLLAYWLAWISVVVALMSPIDVLGAELFYMHMVQHLLLTMIAAPLLMLANPMPFILWGLPTAGRRQFGRVLSKLLHRQSTFRDWFRTATTPAVCWFVALVLLWGWHDPGLYNLALRSDFWHDMEHATFFLSALLYWWHATGTGPRIHPLMSRLKRIFYLLAGVPTTFVAGVAIAFADTVLYTHYLSRPRIPGPLGMSVLNDQMLGGVIMWVPGSMMYFIAAFVLVARWLQAEEKKPPLRIEQLGDDGKLAAPGTRNSS